MKSIPQSNPHSIRRARVEDSRGIHDAHMRSIREVCAKDYSERELAAWGGRTYDQARREDATLNHCVWVIEGPEGIEGYGHLRIHEKDGLELAHIHGLYLAPSAVGKGLGKCLARLMLDEAAKSKAAKVTLESTLTAHAFYESLGFRDAGPQTEALIGGEKIRCIPMALKLGGIEVRRLTIHDLNAYFACRLRALALDPDAFGITTAEETARGAAFFGSILQRSDDDNVIFGAIRGTDVVGVLGILRETRAKSRHKAELWGMFVDVSVRREGLGRKLLDMALTHAHQRMQVETVTLAVETTNTAARSLYESRGFKHWGTEPQATYTGTRYFDKDHMALRLSKA